MSALFECVKLSPRASYYIGGSGGIRTHASGETGVYMCWTRSTQKCDRYTVTGYPTINLQAARVPSRNGFNAFPLFASDSIPTCFRHHPHILSTQSPHAFTAISLYSCTCFLFLLPDPNPDVYILSSILFMLLNPFVYYAMPIQIFS